VESRTHENIGPFDEHSFKRNTSFFYLPASLALRYSHERFFLHIIKLTDSFVSNELPDSTDAFLISEPGGIPGLWPQSASQPVLKSFEE
jgi:hypothetical protein